MAEITRILAADIRRQFFFVIITATSIRCLVQNCQLICYSQRVKATSQQWEFKMFKMAKRSDVCSGETLLVPCTREKRLQRKLTEDYYWIGLQENIGMFSKS